MVQGKGQRVFPPQQTTSSVRKQQVDETEADALNSRDTKTLQFTNIALLCCLRDPERRDGRAFQKRHRELMKLAKCVASPFVVMATAKAAASRLAVHDVLRVGFSDLQRQNVKLKIVNSQRKIKKIKTQNGVPVN